MDRKTPSTKEVPGQQTAAILRQNAIPFLLALDGGPQWQPPAHVARSAGLETRWMRGTVERLQSAGLIDVRTTGKRGSRTTREVAITRRGAKACKILSQLVQELERSSQ